MLSAAHTQILFHPYLQQVEVSFLNLQLKPNCFFSCSPVERKAASNVQVFWMRCVKVLIEMFLHAKSNNRTEILHSNPILRAICLQENSRSFRGLCAVWEQFGWPLTSLFAVQISIYYSLIQLGEFKWTTWLCCFDPQRVVGCPLLNLFS